MSLVDTLKKKARKTKCGQHPLAGEDTAFKELYCVGIALMAHADNEIPESEKALFTNLVEDLGLPPEKVSDLLGGGKSPTEEEIDDVMEGLRTRPFVQKLAFLYDLTRMMDADAKRHPDELSAFDSILDMLKILGAERKLARSLADAVAKEDCGAAVSTAEKTSSSIEIMRMLCYFIYDWDVDSKLASMGLSMDSIASPATVSTDTHPNPWAVCSEQGGRRRP